MPVTSHLLPFPGTKVDEPSAERLAFLERRKADPIARRVFPGTKSLRLSQSVGFADEKSCKPVAVAKAMNILSSFDYSSTMISF